MNQITRRIMLGGLAASAAPLPAVAAPEPSDAADPILDAIQAYRDGSAAYNAAPGEDDELIERTYGRPLNVLQNWEQPAQTREGAMEALRIALETEHEFQGEPFTINMLTAALAYFEKNPCPSCA